MTTINSRCRTESAGTAFAETESERGWPSGWCGKVDGEPRMQALGSRCTEYAGRGERDYESSVAMGFFGLELS